MFLRSWVRTAKDRADGTAAASSKDSKLLAVQMATRCSEARASLGTRTWRGNAPQDPKLTIELTGQTRVHRSHLSLSPDLRSCRYPPPAPPPTHTHTASTMVAVPHQGIFPPKTVELLHQDGKRDKLAIQEQGPVKGRRGPAALRPLWTAMGSSIYWNGKTFPN